MINLKELKQEPFIINNINKLSGGGLYVLYESGVPVYIGQSCNLKKRLQDHYRYMNAEAWNFTPYTKPAAEKYRLMWWSRDVLTFSILSLDKNVWSRNNSEKWYIATYKPKYNIEGVSKPYRGCSGGVKWNINW